MRLYFSLFCMILSLSNFAQVKVSSATFGSMEARAMGPGTMSGRITAIEGVNSEPKIIYVGTAGGGIWKSTNAGASYKSIFDKYCQSIGALAIDQQNPKTIYAGTGESNMRNSVSIGVGVYKSSDAGENWNFIGLDSTEHISKIVIDPKNSNILYVAAPGALWSDSQHRGLYKSTDAGKTWDKVLFIDEKTGCADVLVDPENPNIVYASTWQFRRTPYSFNSGGKGSALYKSTDGGKNWKKISSGLPTGDFGRIAMALAPSAPSNMIAIVESKETGLYISSDAGESWKKQSAPFNVVARPFYFSTIAIDPKDPKRVYRPAFKFSYSDDGGYSFNDASNDGGWVHSDHHALWINPNNTSQMYLGTDGGVYISNDRGATFIFCGNLPVGQFYHVAIDHAEPYRIYGGLQDNGSWIAPSEKPGGIGNGDWQGLYWGDGFWTVPDPNDLNTAYAEYQGGNMARIDLRNFKAYSIQPKEQEGDGKLRWNWNTPIVAGKKALYVGSQYLYKSQDQGKNWEKISKDLTTNDKKKQNQEESGGLSADNTSAENHCTIFTIEESPLDDQIIWVGTDDGNLQYTTNGGKSWTNVSTNYAKAGIPNQTWISSIHCSSFDKNKLFVSFDNHMYGDHKTYLAQSNDMGKTWTAFESKEFKGFAHKIIQDHVNPNLLFAGTEMGLYCSIDGGAQWFRLKNGVPDMALVRDMQIHKDKAVLIVGTHGRGIYIFDNITALRSMTPEMINQEIVFLKPKNIVLSTGKYGGGSPMSNGWMADNPENIPPFQYYLKERLMSGKVNLEIFDAAGKLITSLPGQARKGINKIYWNLRMKPPKVAEGGTKLDFGGFTSPQVLPGVYTLKLSVGDKVFTETITIVHEDRDDYKFEDRILQNEIGMRLYNSHEQLAKVVDNINTQQKQISSTKEKIKSSKNKTYAEEYHQKLEELRTSLLASKQKSLFADEEKLREKITDTYGQVVGAEQRPSNMIIERSKTLEKLVDQSYEDLQKITKKYSSQFDRILQEEGLSDGKKP